LFHRTVAANAMGMIRPSQFVIVGAVLLCFCSGARGVNAATPDPGRRCLGSESAIKDNLPLGTTAHSTEITAVRGILTGAPQTLIAWLYTNRSGRQFLQSQSPESVARLLLRAGDGRLAERVKAGKALAYFPVSSETSASLRRLSSDGVTFAKCFGAGP
jgi:hypothetical protein